MHHQIVPVYIVSLKGSARRVKIAKTLNKFNIDYNFKDAVLGREIPINFVNDINDSVWVKSQYKRKLGVAEIGCSLSHLNIYKEMSKKKISWAIVLEDDVEFDMNFQNEISNKIREFDRNNLYVLGGQDGLECESMVYLSCYDKKQISSNFYFAKTIKSSKYVYRTACYLISLEIAEKILEFTSTHFCLADDWNIFYKHKLFNNIYLANIIHHPLDLSTSLIELERHKKNHSALKNSAIRLKKELRKFIFFYDFFKNHIFKNYIFKN